MPVEIREFHIRINVNERQPSDSNVEPNRNSTQQKNNEKALVAECIEQTLQILEQKKER